LGPVEVHHFGNPLARSSKSRPAKLQIPNETAVFLTSDERKALRGATDHSTADLSCEASILWGRRVRAAIDRRSESVKEGEEDSRRRFPMRESPTPAGPWHRSD
jgi:hypothetical protein